MITTRALMDGNFVNEPDVLRQLGFLSVSNVVTLLADIAVNGWVDIFAVF